MIFQQRRSVGLTPAAVKAAAGATEYMRIARVVNITRTLADLKKRNIWVVGADMDGQKPVSYTHLDVYKRQEFVGARRCTVPC